MKENIMFELKVIIKMPHRARLRKNKCFQNYTPFPFNSLLDLIVKLWSDLVRMPDVSYSLQDVADNVQASSCCI